MCILQCLGYCPKSYVRVLTQSDTLTIAREKAAKTLKEKGDTPEELLQSIKENEAAVAERIATEKAEAERKAAEERERAEAEEKTRIEAEKKEAERIAAEKAEEEARVEAERKAEEERKTKEEERNERDENGQPFVVSSDGTTTFGEITEDTGLTAAPIKLSEGVADKKGNGYGLRHIEARHGDQIRKAGFSSVEEFVKYVASNYDKHNIKIGKKRANGVETYLIQAEDEHSNMLYVELSKDGSYWNVNSGGIFRKGYAEKKKDVGQNTEHPTSATTLQDKSFVQTDKDNGSQSADTHSDKQHPSADKGTTLAADQQSSDKENTKKVADSEGENTLKAKIEAASADVNTEPTEAQKEAGNYKKGHVQVGTFDITIEQPEGSIRRGTDADGKKWEIKMHNTYGYFRGTEGVDGDHIDVFLSNDIDGWNGRKVFVVDQYNPDGTFDEHKVMLGFNDMDEAKSDYLANYEKGWENGRRITVSTTNLEDFKKWIDSSHRKTKPFSEYSSVNKETVATDKGGEKAEKKQEKQSVFDKAKEIADKEEKKRKAEDDSVLGQATRAVGKKKKVNLFKYTASKIISYSTLRGVHYANGYAYASDGYILFKEKADYPKEWEGTTRDKDGNLIDGKYPDMEKAIHRLVHIPDKEVESLPSKEVLDFAIAASKKLKGEAIPVAIDGIFFNAVNLKKFLEAVASKGMDKVVYRHPMLYATNGKDEIVMMPTVNTLEGALDIADRMESAGLPKEQIDAWKAHIEAADKKKSFDDFKKAVENAKKEGVRHTEAEKPKEQPLTEAERKDAEEVAGALGYRVEWVDTMEENGTIDADRKVILIAKDAENPLVQVLGHEVAHGVRRMIGGKFRTLQKAAKEVVGEKEWNERIEKKRNLNAYAEGKLAEEVTCDIVGEALNNKDALKRLAESLRGEKGILARLRNAVAKMVEYFKNRGDKEGVRRMKAADKLLAEFESALKEGVASGQANPEGVDRSVRENRSEKTELTAEERELRDNLVERMRKGGLDVVTDSEEMQRVIDTENERTRMMGAGSVREHRVYHGSGADFDAFDHSHMGEGEGAQAYGWGTYVTEVEGIGRTYAIQNTTTHNDALRALQHDVDAISDQLNRHRDDLKYDEEQLKRANEWRAEAELDYELFRDEAEELKEKYGESSPKYRNHLFNDIYTDEMKRAQSSVKSTEESIQYRKEKIAELEKALKDKQAEIDELPKEFPRHLYTVEIPDDNGSNYLDWDGHPAESLLKDVGSFLESEGFERVQDNPARYEKGESTVVLNPNATGADLYAELREAFGSDKKASQALSELGCIGIKYPADNMRGGRKDGAKNYVIFNENDAKITDHTRFLRTAGGEVYGLVKDGRIYLDPKVATSETPVHEYAHLWAEALRNGNPKEWQNVVELMKGTKVWDEVKARYPELKSDDEIADEVIATYSGRRGAERLREEQRKIAEGNGGVFEKAEAVNALERVKQALKKFWNGVADFLHIHYKSAEEVADRVMKDLLEGVDPRKMGKTKDGGVRFSAKQKRALETASLGNVPRSLTVVSSAAGANVLNNIENLAKEFEKSATQPKTFIGDVAKALGASRFGSGSEYATFETKNGNIVTIRLANHNAHVSGFDHNDKDNGISIVISPKPNEGITNDGNAHITEFYYDSIKLRRAEGKPLAEIVRSIKQALYSGEFKDTTGLAERQEVNGEDVIRYQSSSENSDKTLAGVHNITEEKLRKALKLGGLANPSVAVIDISKNSHEGFGEISLILPSEKVAKRTGKNAGTWQGDAWTPTYPQIERRMSNKGAEKASKDVLSVPSDMYSEVRIGLDRWLDSGEANSAMAYMFLHEKGVAPEPKKIQPKFSDEAYNELKSITAGNFNIYGISKADAQKVLAMYIDAYFDGDKDLYEDKTKAWLEKTGLSLMLVIRVE